MSGRQGIINCTLSTTEVGRMGQVGFAEMQGDRGSMEDAHIVKLMQHGQLLVGVLDGHGGDQVSKRAASLLPTEIQTNMANNTFTQEAILGSFLNVDTSIGYDMSMDSVNQGTTVNLAIADDDKVILCNLGDSRSIYASKGSIIAQTNDHKPNNPDEEARIRAAGGYVIDVKGVSRVNGELAVSRALGDNKYKQRKDMQPFDQAVSCKPDVLPIQRVKSGHEFIIVACDGVWDVLKSDDVVGYVYYLFSQGCTDMAKIAQFIINIAYSKGSTDNLTCIIVRLVPSSPARPSDAWKTDFQPWQIETCIQASKPSQVETVIGETTDIPRTVEADTPESRLINRWDAWYEQIESDIRFTLHKKLPVMITQWRSIINNPAQNKYMYTIDTFIQTSKSQWPDAFKYILPFTTSRSIVQLGKLFEEVKDVVEIRQFFEQFYRPGMALLNNTATKDEFYEYSFFTLFRQSNAQYVMELLNTHPGRSWGAIEQLKTSIPSDQKRENRRAAAAPSLIPAAPARAAAAPAFAAAAPAFAAAPPMAFPGQTARAAPMMTVQGQSAAPMMTVPGQPARAAAAPLLAAAPPMMTVPGQPAPPMYVSGKAGPFAASPPPMMAFSSQPAPPMAFPSQPAAAPAPHAQGYVVMLTGGDGRPTRIKYKRRPLAIPDMHGIYTGAEINAMLDAYDLLTNHNDQLRPVEEINRNIESIVKSDFNYAFGVFVSNMRDRIKDPEYNRIAYVLPYVNMNTIVTLSTLSVVAPQDLCEVCKSNKDTLDQATVDIYTTERVDPFLALLMLKKEIALQEIRTVTDNYTQNMKLRINRQAQQYRRDIPQDSKYEPILSGSAFETMGVSRQ